MAPRSRRIVVWTATAVLTIAMSLVVPPQSAVAAVMVDQQQTGIDEEQIRVAGGEATIEIAQIVTVGLAGELVRVDLAVQCVGGADLIIEIRDVVSGIPGATITTTTVTGSTIPPFWTLFQSPSLRSFTLASTVPVTVGEKIAIVLRSTGTVAATNACGTFAGPVGETYAGGDAYFKHTQGAPSWTCFCVHANSAEDFAFRTWVDVAEADLSITKSLIDLEYPGATNTFANTLQLYRLTVTNAGPDDATAVTIIDTLPGNVTFFSASAVCAHASGKVTCTLASVPSGTSDTVSITFKFNNAGSYVNSASVSANESDPDTTDTTATLTTQVRPTADLQFSSITSYGVFVLAPGENLTYTANFLNNGPDPAGDVLLLATIPTGAQFVSISSPNTTICGQNGTSATEYGCRFNGGITVGATRSMTLTIKAPISPQGLTTNFALSHIISGGALILDFPLYSSWDMHAWVVSESTQTTVTAGGSATTDTESDGATVNDPIETTVTPSGGGTVSITERRKATPALTNWTLVGVEVVISAPAGTASAPITITFRIQKELLLGADPALIQVFRNNSATPVAVCTKSGTPPQPVIPISPDPCIGSRTVLGDGDLEIVVLTSQASVWGFGVHEPFRFGGFEAPMGSTRRAGSTLPVKFDLYYESSGEIVSEAELQVLLRGSPSSRDVSCDTGSPLHDWEPTTVVGGGLHFDPDTSTYSINWKTDKAWAGTCRELMLQFIDGSEHTTILVFN
jgi:uncharacterized repeat protein (TIGR01451 family)